MLFKLNILGQVTALLSWLQHNHDGVRGSVLPMSRFSETVSYSHKSSPVAIAAVRPAVLRGYD